MFTHFGSSVAQSAVWYNNCFANGHDDHTEEPASPIFYGFAEPYCTLLNKNKERIILAHFPDFNSI